jgi:hypothetical protein
MKIRRATELFIAVRSHFEGGYDGFKYDWKLANIPEKESHYYEKLARKFNHEKDLLFFLFAAFVRHDIRFVGDLFTDEVTDGYNKAQKYRNALTKKFTDDIRHLSECDIMNSGKGLIRKALQGHLNIETAAIIADCLGLFDIWETKYANDPFMSSWVARLKKYLQLMPYDRTLIVSGISVQFEKDKNVS